MNPNWTDELLAWLMLAAGVALTLASEGLMAITEAAR